MEKKNPFSQSSRLMSAFLFQLKEQKKDDLLTKIYHLRHDSMVVTVSGVMLNLKLKENAVVGIFYHFKLV